MRLGKSSGDTRTKTILGIARLYIITNMPSPGEHPWCFFFPIGAEKPGKAVSPARAGVWGGEGRVRYSLGKEEKM